MTYHETSGEMLSRVRDGENKQTLSKEWLGPKISNSNLERVDDGSSLGCVVRYAYFCCIRLNVMKISFHFADFCLNDFHVGLTTEPFES